MPEFNVPHRRTRLLTPCSPAPVRKPQARGARVALNRCRNGSPGMTCSAPGILLQDAWLADGASLVSRKHSRLLRVPPPAPHDRETATRIRKPQARAWGMRAIPPVRCPERLDSPDFFFERPRRIPQVEGPLGIEPEIRRISEQPRQPHRHLRADRPAGPQKFVDGLPRYSDRIGQAGHSEPVVWHEILPQHLAWMRRPPRHAS